MAKQKDPWLETLEQANSLLGISSGDSSSTPRSANRDPLTDPVGTMVSAPQEDRFDSAIGARRGFEGVGGPSGLSGDAFTAELTDKTYQEVGFGGLNYIESAAYANRSEARENFLATINAAALTFATPGTRESLEGTADFIPSDFDPLGQFKTEEQQSMVARIFERGRLGTPEFADDGSIANIPADQEFRRMFRRG